jgi:hypothetical protein
MVDVICSRATEPTATVPLLFGVTEDNGTPVESEQVVPRVAATEIVAELLVTAVAPVPT